MAGNPIEAHPSVPSELERLCPGKTDTLRSLWTKDSGFDPFEDEESFKDFSKLFHKKTEPMRRLSWFLVGIAFSVLLAAVVFLDSKWDIPVLVVSTPLLVAVFVLRVSARRMEGPSGGWKEVNAAYARALDFCRYVHELSHFLEVPLGELLSFNEGELNRRVDACITRFCRKAHEIYNVGKDGKPLYKHIQEVDQQYGYARRRLQTFNRFWLGRPIEHYDKQAALIDA